MAEKRSLLSRVKSWFTAVVGLCSGAILMYVSPLVERVVKPPRPLANFAVETDGLTATFSNRYTGEGWWDFGDGSPLEPASPNQEIVSHAYSKPGTYTARLQVRNFVGDEHERTVSVEVGAPANLPVAPIINALEVLPVNSDRTAPATFRLVAQTSGADRCVWDLGAEKGIEASSESLAKQEKLVTFSTPGQHIIQVTALNGTQAVRKAVAVQVDPPRGDSFVARLRITDRGNRIEKRAMNETVPITLGRSSGSIKIDRRISARTGFSIADAKLGVNDPAFSNLKLDISPDRKSVHLTGSLNPSSAMQKSPTPPAVSIQLIQERPLRSMAKPTDVAASITIPGVTTLPLPTSPAELGQVDRSMLLELRTASGPVWEQPVPAKGSLIEYQGRRYLISATPSEREVKVEIQPAR